MPNTKISQFPSVTTLNNADVFPVVQSNETKKVDLTALSNSILAKVENDATKLIKKPVSAAPNQVLKYVGGQWVASNEQSLQNYIQKPNSPSQGDMLMYNGVSWVSINPANLQIPRVLAWCRWYETKANGVYDRTGYNISNVTRNASNRILTFSNPITGPYIVLATAKASDAAIDKFGENYAAEGIPVDTNRCYVNYYAEETGIIFNVAIIGGGE